MKKSIILIIAALFVFGLTSSSFAGPQHSKSLGVSHKVITGKVLSVDTEKGSFLLEFSGGRTQKTIYAGAKQIASLKAGDSVIVTLPIPGSRAAKIAKR